MPKLSKLKVLNDRYSLSEALEGAVDFRLPAVRSDEQLFKRFALASQRYAGVAGGLQRICRRFADYDFIVPAIAAFDSRAAALPYRDTCDLMSDRVRQAIHALVKRLDVPQFGRITWADEQSCQFTYYEVVRDPGILRSMVCRIAHQHDLVKARQHKLPATGIAIPKRGREILRAIPEPLIPYTRVITGLEVRKQEHDDSSRDELTWLGKALASGTRELGRAANAAATGMAAAGRSIADSVSSVASKMSQALAVADPAIVIGEVCLYGWEN